METSTEEPKNPVLAKIIGAMLGKTEQNYRRELHFSGFSTGFPQFDRLVGGISPGQLWVVTGRPSMGKTAFMASIACNAVFEEEKRIAFFTSDHSSEDLARRMLAIESRIAHRKISDGNLSDNEWPRLINAAASFTDASLDIFETSWLLLQGIEEKIESASYDLIVIDKFHSLVFDKEAAEGSNNRINELNQCVIELKGLARKLNTTIVILCDINKGQEQRTDPRPMLVDLKDFGGVLESFADLVVGIYSPNILDPWNPEYTNQSEVILLKNRFGSRDSVKLSFFPEFGLFQELEAKN